MNTDLFLFFLLVLAVFIWLWIRARKRNRMLMDRIDEISSRKQSLSTKYGKMTEQFMPFLESYPYDRHSFRFLGTPIDGVQFENDKIVFVEFKASDSRLTEKQRHIKELIDSGKVYFKQIHLK